MTSTRPSAVVPRRRRLRTRRRIATPRGPREPLAVLANRYAATILSDTVSVNGCSEDADDALMALMRRSRYYERGIESIEADGVGALMNSCFDAGLALGVAFGRRLRGDA